MALYYHYEKDRYRDQYCPRGIFTKNSHQNACASVMDIPRKTMSDTFFPKRTRNECDELLFHN